ncbi:glutamate receptor ionotropic, kainate 2 [Orussus abietinus]|uniref:glutamate receptor ionotropic, kainate 2 n=1 Tax=Orussus abietinus TaxID=222816 RepID=UPI000624F94D|nr:glutamate receptor ionotropic, kainate 2 [Orussus abietinus]
MLIKLLLVAVLPCVTGFLKKVHIGGLFDQDDIIKKAFEASVKSVNRDRRENREFSYPSLIPESRTIETDVFEASQIVCELLGTGVAGIFGPQDKTSAGHVQSMCDTMEVPHIAVRWDPEPARGKAINLYPHADTYSTVFYRIIKDFHWKSFTLLYEDGDSLTRMRMLLQRWSNTGNIVTLRRLGKGPDFRSVLRMVKKSTDFDIILDCSYEILPEVLIQAQQVGIMSDRYKYIITNLDLQAIDIEPYQYSEVNITGVRLIDPGDPVVQDIFGNYASDWELESPTQLRAEPALMYDAVQLFYQALKQLQDAVEGDVKQLSCDGSQSWEHGFSLSNFMRLGEMKGLTGLIKFDTSGFRSNFHLDIMQVTQQGLDKVGTWNSSNGIEWIHKTVIPEDPSEQSLQNKTFVVLISLAHPYGMLKESEKTMSGNDRYEGFAVDIIEELSKMLHFNYTFDHRGNDNYGSLNKRTGQWDGMMLKIMQGEGDLGITDLTITADRESAVDFTLPFMNLGISILFKKATKSPPSLFSFLSPFSNDVWLYLIVSYILVSLLLFVIGRLCPAEWNNPYPCVDEPEELENQFTLKNSLWFTIGSIMQQGSEIAPIGISTRMMAGSWWFFCLIMVASYTANLAAFLTFETLETPIKSAQDLANQNVIKYGAKSGGSTYAFFRDSEDPIYQKMYQYMKENAAEVLTKTNDEGINKVLDGGYAFFMESSSIEYVQDRECNVTQVGEPLDSKGYGIAMKKNSPYRNALSKAVLKLQEDGILTKLKTRWWHEKRGGGKCLETSRGGETNPLGLDNVGGVFLVLVVGVALSCLFSITELLWDVGCAAYKENISFVKLLMEEIKFVMQLGNSSKPARKAAGSSGKSEEGSTRGCTPPYGFVPTVITTSPTSDK